MLTFFIDPAVLWLILFLVARKQGVTAYSTLFYLTMGITIVAFGLALFLSPFAVYLLPVVCVLAFKRFCYIDWLRAILATTLYMGWKMFSPVLVYHLIYG
jgi:hypothetical protein